MMGHPRRRTVTTLATYVVVLGAGALVVFIGSALGLDGREPGVVVVAAVAALLSLLFVVRHD